MRPLELKGTENWIKGIVDTHAHYDDAAFGDDRARAARLNTVHEACVDAIINCACDKKSLRKTVELSKNFPFVYAALGYHPENLKGLEYDDLDILYDKAEGNTCAEGGKVAAIGEIGLDYHWMSSPKEEQQDWFLEQLELSKELELPVIIHSREATEDTLRILEENAEGLAGGVIHAFSGPVEVAERYLKLGFYLGIGGVASFGDSKKLRKALAMKDKIPTERLLLETDCPYLAPEPFRGQVNDSRLIGFTACAVAELRGEDPAGLILQCANNARELFHLK